MASIEKAPQRRLGRVVSIDPRARRVAHAYFNNGQLKECDQKTFRDSRLSARAQRVVIPYLIQVLDRCAPHAILVPDTRPVGARHRSQFGRQVIAAVVKEATRRGTAVHILSGRTVKEAFRDSDGKQPGNRAVMFRGLIKRLPELLSMLPDPREHAWKPEQYFTPLFNAVAMYLAWEYQPSPADERDAAKW